MVSENNLAAILLIAVGLPGLCFNLLLIFPVLHSTTSFEKICAFRASADAAVIMIMIVFSATVIFLESSTLGESIIGKLCGNVIRYCFFLVHYTQIIFAINRFMAIYCFAYYKKIFSSTNTKKILILLGIYLLWYFSLGFINGCGFIFRLSSWTWTFESITCAEFISKYVDFYIIVSFLIAGTALDLLTAVGIYRYLRENSRADRHFSHTDVLFFIQSCTTNLLLIICLLIVANLIPVYQTIFGERQEHFAIFVMTTLLMEISHALDGLIMVLFNPKTRAQLLRPQSFFRKAKKNPVVCTITVLIPQIDVIDNNRLLLLLLLSGSINFVLSQCTFGNASLLATKLLCAKLFPLLNLCNFSEVYKMPLWNDYYPIVEMEKPKNLTCYKYEAKFATDLPIMCVCDQKNCHNEDDLKLAIKSIQPISLDGTAIAEETLRKYINCLLKRIDKSTKKSYPPAKEGLEMDAHHPLLNWYERVIEDEKVEEEDSSWAPGSSTVYAIVFIYIAIFSFSYVCIAMCRARKSRTEISR